MGKDRQREKRHPRKTLRPIRRFFVVTTYVMGLVGLYAIPNSLGSYFLPSINDWTYREVAWFLLFVVLAFVVLFAHLFFGFLIGGVFDRQRDDKQNAKLVAQKPSTASTEVNSDER